MKISRDLIYALDAKKPRLSAGLWFIHIPASGLPSYLAVWRIAYMLLSNWEYVP